MALEAQKRERQKYKQLLQLAIQNEAAASPQNSGPKGSIKHEEPILNQGTDVEINANDIFKHTYVDIVDASDGDKQVFQVNDRSPPTIHN
jgi:hypothetical protein